MAKLEAARRVVIEASRVTVGTAHIAAMNIVGSLVAFVFTVGIARLLTPADCDVERLSQSEMWLIGMAV